MALFKPDRYFARITRIDIDRDILAQGYRCVLLDIDNTILSPRDECHSAVMWAHGSLARGTRGITFCLVSNNWHGNVRELADDLALPIVAKAMKPFPAAFTSLRAARSVPGARKRSLSGDQLMTDVVGAHLAGHEGVPSWRRSWRRTCRIRSRSVRSNGCSWATANRKA